MSWLLNGKLIIIIRAKIIPSFAIEVQ